MDTLTEHEVMIRVESVNIHGKKQHKVEAIRKDQLSRILSVNGGNKSYHQIIDSDMIRLFFDIDSNYSQDQLDYQLTQLIGFLPHYSVLKSDGKDSYHVYYDVNVSIIYAKWIANKLQQHIP
jgi:ABC-type Zn uptake system ZnuABC Zn-binding protein ZnuA